MKDKQGTQDGVSTARRRRNSKRLDKKDGASTRILVESGFVSTATMSRTSLMEKRGERRYTAGSGAGVDGGLGGVNGYGGKAMPVAGSMIRRVVLEPGVTG